MGCACRVVRVHLDNISVVEEHLGNIPQVCGRNDTTYHVRVQLDIYYIHRWLPWLDLYLLCREVGTV